MVSDVEIDQTAKLVVDQYGDVVLMETSLRQDRMHTVQGREAEAVIFVLGAPSPAQTGARGWAGGKPNLLNVAVTRAKEVVYVVGNRQLWKNAGLFRELADRV